MGRFEGIKVRHHIDHPLLNWLVVLHPLQWIQPDKGFAFPPDGANRLLELGYTTRLQAITQDNQNVLLAQELMSVFGQELSEGLPYFGSA